MVIAIDKPDEGLIDKVGLAEKWKGDAWDYSFGQQASRFTWMERVSNTRETPTAKREHRGPTSGASDQRGWSLDAQQKVAKRGKQTSLSWWELPITKVLFCARDIMGQ